MPIYEYACSSCGHAMEKLQKISDPPLTDCPECNQATLQKLVSAPGFRLKGGGWYETDFKTGSKKNVSGDGGKEKPKTETKPAAKAESTVKAKSTTRAKSADS